MVVRNNRKGFSTIFFALAMISLLYCNPTSAFVNQTTMQQPTLYKEWSYFFEHQIHAGVPSNTQLDVQAEDNLSGQQMMKQRAFPSIVGLLVPNGGPAEISATPAPSPSPSCGYGPTLPRSLISERTGGSGVTTAASPWPFLVNLKKNSDPAGVFFCSGSLISKQYVLLAAQCLANMSVIGIAGVTLWIGQSNQNGPLVPQMTRTITQYVTHSGYNPSNYVNDIALIKMNMPVTFSSSVGPVCLPPASVNPNQHAGIRPMVMGWGPTTQGAVSTTLKQGQVMIESISNCIAIPSSYSQYVTNLNICIRAMNNNVFTCLADVGGPVVINTAPIGATPIWTQVGINSFTKNCASTGLKTRVSAFRVWISSIAGV